MAVDAPPVLNKLWDAVVDVTAQLKFDALHKDKLTFPSHPDIKIMDHKNRQRVIFVFWVALSFPSQRSA